MRQDPDSILRFIQSKSDHPMKVKELARALSIEQSDYGRFRQAVGKLVDSGDLVRLKRGRIGLADQMNIVVGRISVNRSGTGFVEREGDEQDILIPKTELQTALDGDSVMVRLTGRPVGRQAGTVIKVMERVQRNIVGLFHHGRGYLYLKPDNPRIHRDIYIHPDDSLGARDGEKVVAVLTEWEDSYLNPQGKVTERLGYPDQPGVDMLAVIRSYNLPEKFSPEVLRQAERAAAVDTSEEEARRLDLTAECVYTIDPADARDHDDAVSVERTATGYRLGVHIADVSFYVKEGTTLDTEGFERGNSVYLPGMVVPMLPEVLSNDVCSLKPNRRRLAYSVFIDFDHKGKVREWRLADTVIRSRARLSYDEVQEFFDSDVATKRIKRVADSLRTARKLARLLAGNRSAEGSLDFDLPEAKIILNEKGQVIELGNRVRLESHRLVEEFMLAANRVVALEVFRKAQPFLYRVHDRPDLEKVQAFSDMMRRLGHQFPVSKTIRPVQFARFLEKVKDAPEGDFINELMLRSMKKAVYQRKNIGHFGLAFSHYTHFTSPIRRYPDLLVHRLLRKLKRDRYPVAFGRRVGTVIDHVGRQCSETERNAEAAERQAVRVKQVAYMARHLGEEYAGVISGTTPYGFFVRLDDMGAEGMVRMSLIDDDYYQYDEKQYRIIGRRTGRSFRLGDAVRVRVVKVDTERSEIDLEVARPESKPPATATRKAKVRKRRRVR
ncbi:MAG TPA: ribonuclease R [Acidobacteriota bacterium]|nr:ribonuclease R [Acidobacteriota bacterium]